MKFIDKLKQHEENVYTTCRVLFDLIDVKVTSKTLKADIEKDTYFPSLLTVKNVLQRFGVESAAIYRNERHYADFQPPFITSIQKPEWSTPYFTVVRSASDSDIEYYSPTELKWTRDSISHFSKWDKNVVLLSEKGDFFGENDYRVANRRHKREKLIRRLPVYIFLCLVILSVVFSINQSTTISSIYRTTYLMLTIGGAGLAFMLCWYEIDAQNPFLKEVCSGGKKVNCGAVLSTKGAKIFGMEWSVLGLGYFLASIVSLLTIGLYSLNAFAVLSLISLIISPYILYSVFYQYKIVKQWCPLCLATQGVLFLQLVLSAMFLFSAEARGVIDSQNLVNILILYAVIISTVTYIFPFIKKAKLGRMYELKWKRLKANPNVFSTLLKQQTKIQKYPSDLGIILGNPKAETEIIKVCNPYCGPCSRAHPILEKIVNNNKNVKVRIIFTAKDSTEDFKAKPVRHLMALAEVKEPANMQRVLDDWYINKEIHKDYDLFAQKYPMNGELTRQGEKLSKMSQWCEEMKIRATPTLFINGFEMMDNYSVEDLEDIFMN